MTESQSCQCLVEAKVPIGWWLRVGIGFLEKVESDRVMEMWAERRGRHSREEVCDNNGMVVQIIFGFIIYSEPKCIWKGTKIRFAVLIMIKLERVSKETLAIFDSIS